MTDCQYSAIPESTYSLNTPEYTSDVSNGYIQSKNSIYYSGVTDYIKSGYNTDDKYGYFVIANPKNSGVNVILNSFYFSNLSTTPVVMDVFYSVNSLRSNLNCSNNIANSNSNTSSKYPKAQLYSGTDVCNIGGTWVRTIICSPQSSCRDIANSSIIIAPGYCHVYRVKAINSNNTCTGNASFSWWEQPKGCTC